MWRTRTGSPWRDLPATYGMWKTVYNRHRRWSADGTWERILDALRTGADDIGAEEWRVSIDATVIRAHHHAAGARHTPPKDVPADRLAPTALEVVARDRRRAGARSNYTETRCGPVDREGLGRSRGGVTSKVHVAADIRCRPVSRVTTAGQRHDSLAFEPVLAGIRIARFGRGRPRTRPDRVLADKAYSSRRIRESLRGTGIKATIPERSDQIKARQAKGAAGGRPPAFDAEIYKQRNTVERAINKLREVRAVATRYDKRDYVFRGTIDVASIRIWLRDPVHRHSRDTP